MRKIAGKSGADQPRSLTSVALSLVHSDGAKCLAAIGQKRVDLVW